MVHSTARWEENNLCEITFILAYFNCRLTLMIRTSLLNNNHLLGKSNIARDTRKPSG